jgi:hypothetical protein
MKSESRTIRMNQDRTAEQFNYRLLRMEEECIILNEPLDYHQSIEEAAWSKVKKKCAEGPDPEASTDSSSKKIHSLLSLALVLARIPA